MTVVAVGALMVVTGCGSTKDGTATPSTGAADTSAATAALWDPCTQVPEQLLQKLGMEPSSKKADVAGVPEPGWKVCGWHDPEYPFNYDLGVWSTIHTVEDFKRKTSNVDFVDISIGGRNGFQFRDVAYERDEACDLIFPATQGAFQITTFNISSKSRQVPPCDRAKAAAEVLVPIFPR